ncbi:hypothetical protein AAFF_G00069880 [Aldrovandia affinis]|uniref:Uncharacterized protein n=1 Tax=Aldrovandia affinis TaxID=143900 RepID=A0AAD7R1J1_9TELE|nr:hypothetical protein AAFF_G00069880 [Aldrovandia affinis]
MARRRISRSRDGRPSRTGRTKDVETAWQELNRRRARTRDERERSCTHHSLLIKASMTRPGKVIDPGTVTGRPNEGHLRRYYVAYVAAARGDQVTAKRYSDAIVLTIHRSQDGKRSKSRSAGQRRTDTAGSESGACADLLDERFRQFSSVLTQNL